jgi:hypothetical protein
MKNNCFDWRSSRALDGPQTSTQFFRFALLGIAVVAAGGSAPGHAAQAAVKFGPAWTSVDCKTFDVPPAIAAQSECGYVTVPEQHAKPQGRSIQLGVVRTRSTGQTPASDPLFVEQGGPGDSTIGDIANGALPKYPELPALLQGRDLIFVEERGTRFAKPFLFCPELNAHNIAVAQGKQSYTDPGWIR